MAFASPNADGVFRLPAFGSGPHTLVVKSPNYGLATFTLLPSSTAVPLLLSPGGYLVVDLPENVGPCQLSAFGGDGRPLALSYDGPPGPLLLPLGGLLLTQLAAGWYRLMVDGCQLASPVREVVIEPGKGTRAAF